jgi:hypothetical protein
MTLQACHTCICGVFPFFSADPLKRCQVGWGAWMHSYFQVSPEMFDQVQVQALSVKVKEICPKATLVETYHWWENAC